MGAREATRDPEADRRRIIVACDSVTDGLGVLATLQYAPIATGVRLERIPMAELYRRADLAEDDLILVVPNRAPDASRLTKFAALSRRLPMALVVPVEHLVDWEAMDAARSFGLIAREGLGPKVLETALRALLRARRNERRLLEILGSRNAALSELRVVAADMEMAADELVSRFEGAPRGAAEFAAREAVDALAEAGVRIAGALAAADADLPTDLARVVEARVGRNGQEWDPHVFALMSEDPIWLAASERRVGAMLDELLALWRGGRGAGDRLELIVWDAGESARIAAVFSRGSGPEWNASLAWLVGDLIAHLQPLARAFGGRLEAPRFAGENEERGSFTLTVPKRAIGAPPARRERPGVNGDLVNHYGD